MERILLKVKKTSQVSPGGLSVSKGEILLLLDDIFGHKADNLLLAQKKFGAIGYVSVENVDFLSGSDEMAWPYLESLISSFFNGDSLATSCLPICKSLNSPVKPIRDVQSNKSCLSIEKKDDTLVPQVNTYGIRTKSAEELNPRQTSDCDVEQANKEVWNCTRAAQLFQQILVHIKKSTDDQQTIPQVKELASQLELVHPDKIEEFVLAIGRSQLKELVEHFLMGCTEGAAVSILCLLKVLCRSGTAQGILLQSNLPLVLMMEFIYKRIKHFLLVPSLDMLKTLFETFGSYDIPSSLRNLIEVSFLPFLLDCIASQTYEEEILNLMTRVLCCLYEVNPIADLVLAKILSVTSSEISRHLIEIARNGANDSIWRLVTDLVCYECDEGNISETGFQDLIELARFKLNSTKSFTKESELYFALLEALCCSSQIKQNSTFIFKLEKTLREANEIPNTPSHLKNKIWTLLGRMNSVKDTYDIFPFRQTSEENVVSSENPMLQSQVVYMSNKVYREMIKLSQYLALLRSVTKNQSSVFHLHEEKAEILNFLYGCRDVLYSLHFYPIHLIKKTRSSFPYDLKDLQNTIGSFDYIFCKIGCLESQKLIVQVLIEICDLFPPVVNYINQMETLTCCLKQMKDFTKSAMEMFQLCTILLRRVFSMKINLPTSLLKHISANFVRYLIDIIEYNVVDEAEFEDNITSLILAVNIHQKNNVMEAFGHGPCGKTIAILLDYLQNGHWLQNNTESMAIIDSFHLPMKLYSDLLENAETSDLLHSDCLRSVVKFSLNYLTVVVLIHTVPESMTVYLCRCFRSNISSTASHSTSWIGLIQEAISIFSNKVVRSSDAIGILRRIEEVAKTKHIEKSKSYSHLPNTLCKSTPARGCLSMSCVKAKMDV